MIVGVIGIVLFSVLPSGLVIVIFSISPALTVPSFGIAIRTFDVFKFVSRACSTLLKVPSLLRSLIKVTRGSLGIIVSSPPLYPLIELSYDAKALFASLKFLYVALIFE